MINNNNNNNNNNNKYKFKYKQLKRLKLLSWMESVHKIVVCIIFYIYFNKLIFLNLFIIIYF